MWLPLRKPWDCASCNEPRERISSTGQASGNLNIKRRWPWWLRIITGRKIQKSGEKGPEDNYFTQRARSHWTYRHNSRFTKRISDYRAYDRGSQIIINVQGMRDLCNSSFMCLSANKSPTIQLEPILTDLCSPFRTLHSVSPCTHWYSWMTTCIWLLNVFLEGKAIQLRKSAIL